MIYIVKAMTPIKRTRGNSPLQSKSSCENQVLGYRHKLNTLVTVQRKDAKLSFEYQILKLCIFNSFSVKHVFIIFTSL